MTGRSTISASIAALALTAIVAVPGHLHADGDGDTGQVVEAGDIDFDVGIDPTNLEVGKRFTVTLKLSYPTGTQVYFPEAPDVKPFKLMGHTRDAAHVEGTAGGETHQLVLLPVRVGTSVLKPFEVPFLDADGQAGMARTPELRIQVGSTLGDETNPEMAPAGDPVPVHVPNLVLIWVLAGLAIAIVAAASGVLGYRAWRRWKEAHQPPPPPRPPLEVALERLLDIEARGLAVSGEFKELALEVSEVVREFLGGSMGFMGVEMTTFDIMLAVEGKDLGRATPPELEDFLGFCDLIKFAKLVPTEDEIGGLVPRARDIVGRVAVAYRVEEEVEEEGDEQ